MNKLFEYGKITQDYWASRLHAVKYNCFLLSAAIPIIMIISGFKFQWTPILIAITLFVIGYFMHLKFNPLDKIILTSNSLIIKYYGQNSRIIKVKDIDSFSSNTSLHINLKSGKYIKINYSDWIIPMQKVKELTTTLNELIK